MGGFDYRDLTVWQKSIDLVEVIYRHTAGFPNHETFGLTQQLRRAVVSIPSNIAEGQGRGSPREFRNFLGIARGSLNEVETQLVIAARLKYISPEMSTDLSCQCQEVTRLINGLIKSIDRKP